MQMEENKTPLLVASEKGGGEEGQDQKWLGVGCYPLEEELRRMFGVDFTLEKGVAYNSNGPVTEQMFNAVLACHHSCYWPLFDLRDDNTVSVSVNNNNTQLDSFIRDKRDLGSSQGSCPLDVIGVYHSVLGLARIKGIRVIYSAIVNTSIVVVYDASSSKAKKGEEEEEDAGPRLRLLKSNIPLIHDLGEGVLTIPFRAIPALKAELNPVVLLAPFPV